PNESVEAGLAHESSRHPQGPHIAVCEVSDEVVAIKGAHYLERHRRLLELLCEPRPAGAIEGWSLVLPDAEQFIFVDRQASVSGRWPAGRLKRKKPVPR